MSLTVHAKPIMLIAGDDTISREKAEHNAIADIIGQYPDASIERFDPEKHDVPEYVENMLTSSMFQTMRIFILREIQSVNKDGLKLINDIFSYKLTDQYLILETGLRTEKKGKSKAVSADFGKWLAHFLELTESEPDRFSFAEYLQPPEWKTAEWVVMQTPLLTGRTIGMKEAQYLVDLAGSDTTVLYSELQKIDVHLAQGQPIGRNDIANITGATRQMTPFELAAAVGKKDMVRVLEIIDSLYSGNVYIPLYISALFRHFWALYRIRNYALEHPDDITTFTRSRNRELQNEAGLRIGIAAGLLTAKQSSRVFPVMVKDRVVEQAMSYTLKQYTTSIGWLKDYDIGIKTGRINDSKTGLQLLCYKMVKFSDIA
jgi:DNA polymerase III delta subunit